MNPIRTLALGLLCLAPALAGAAEIDGSQLSVLWGVPFAGVLLSIALLLVAVGLPLRAWVSYDWYAIEVLMAWGRTSGPALDSARWGGASVSHFPLHPRHRRREPRGMAG